MLIGTGLLLAVGSGLLPLLFDDPFLTAIWWEVPLGAGVLEIGTPLIFDTGVYVTVLGVALTIMLALAEE
jgi:multisubunit Na+/H+ antiporter MnhB subunit